MVTIIGSVAALLTAACWIPQMAKSLRKGTAEDFAWPYLAMLVTGVTAWFVYGILRQDPPIYLCNGFTGLCVLVVAMVKIRTRHVVVGGVELALPATESPEHAVESLVALGPNLAAELRQVGIADTTTLRAVGVDEAARRLEEAGLGDAERSRHALHGAISGPRWTATEAHADADALPERRAAAPDHPGAPPRAGGAA